MYAKSNKNHNPLNLKITVRSIGRTTGVINIIKEIIAPVIISKFLKYFLISNPPHNTKIVVLWLKVYHHIQLLDNNHNLL